MIEKLNITKGGLFVLDRGSYELVTDAPLRPGNYLTIRGSGMGLTKIYGSLDLIGVEGGSTFSLFELSSFSLYGNINMVKCTMGSLERVIIREPPNGVGLTMQECWDCYFGYCHFIRSINGLRMVDSEATSIAEIKNTNCNNHTFIGCRWENNTGLSLYMGEGATKNRFIGCKWHGSLPVPAVADHIVMRGCYDNMFDNINITNGGANGIRMLHGRSVRCVDNSISGNIGNCRGWGIDGVRGNKYNVIWSSTYGRNRLGDLREAV